MNYLIIAAGIISLFATVGHFTMGRKLFLLPVLNSNIEPIPKKVMHSLFHYMSVVQVFSTLFLFAIGFGFCKLFTNFDDVARLLGIFYAGFAIIQFIIAAGAKIEGGLFKLFQWIFWALIAVLCIAGS